MNSPSPRVADLSTPLDRATAAITAAGDFRAVKITVKDGPNLKFRGRVVAEYQQNPERPRWEELILFAVEGAGWVAARAWHSNVAGEESFWHAAEVATVEDAMAAWGWSATAKGFARRLKWDVAKRIGAVT